MGTLQKLLNEKSNSCANLSASAMLQASQGCLAGVVVRSVSQGFGGGAAAGKNHAVVSSRAKAGGKSQWLGAVLGLRESW